MKAKNGGVWRRLKYEGGVHRVQRVPATESQGRIHTSAAGVLVLPEAEEVDVEIDPNDLRIDVYRSSGPGGQSVNTTDSAVRITHLPTGIVVSCQNEKSQLQNKEPAMRILRSRLLAAAQEAAAGRRRRGRRSQVRTVDRSERIRTYNFPENRISDHRVGFKAYNLDQVLDGDLDAVIQALVDADNAARMAAGDGGDERPGPMPEKLREVLGIATRGWPPPASPARAATRSSSPRSCHGVSRSQLATGAVVRPGRRRWTGTTTLVARREAREPLQHITGRGRLPVHRARRSGPGCSCRARRPRSVAGWAIDAARARMNVVDPIVVDLCTGSGAIALAIAHEVPAVAGARRRARPETRSSWAGATPTSGSPRATRR